MMSNPNTIRQLAEHDPSLKQMLEEHPEMIDMMTSQSTLEMLNDPQVVGMALGMANRMNRGPTVSTLQGSAFPTPGGSSPTPAPAPGQATSQPAQPAPSPLGGGFNMMDMMRMLNRKTLGV